MSGPQVTVADLQRLGACRNHVALFQREFGSFVDVTEENVMRAFKAGIDVDWWAIRIFGSEYQRAKAPAWTEYQRAKAPAWTKYQRAKAPAWTEYQRAKAPAWTEYQRVTAQAKTEYDRVTAQAIAGLAAARHATTTAGAS